MKKAISIVILMIVCALPLCAKIYTFKMTPIADGIPPNYVVTYDSSTKRFSLLLRESNVIPFGWLFGGQTGMPEDELESLTVYDNIPVELYLTDNTLNYGGNVNELLFVDHENKIYFGVYVDPEKFDYDNRRTCYALVNKKEEGFVKEKCCVMLPPDYVVYDELVEIAKPLKSILEKPSISSEKTNSSAVIPFKDFVNKAFGLYDIRAIGKDSFSKIEKELKNNMGKEIKVQKISSKFRTFDIYDPSLNVAGRQPTYIRLSKSDFSGVHVSYEYNFIYDNPTDAETFVNSLYKKVNEDCDTTLKTVENRSGNDYTGYIGSYNYNGLDYTLQVGLHKRTDGKYSASLSCSIFLD